MDFASNSICKHNQRKGKAKLKAVDHDLDVLARVFSFQRYFPINLLQRTIKADDAPYVQSVHVLIFIHCECLGGLISTKF
jgi:hypothetical protein